jgi:hypothetical protein
LATKSNIKVVINKEALNAYVANPGGPVMRHMMVLGEAVKTEAIARLSNKGSGGWTVRGFLGPTIVKRVVEVDGMPRVQVGSDHTKTAAHLITGNPTLTFFWPKVGKVVSFHQVHHPGSEFRNYLLVQLAEALKVVSAL